MPGDHQPAGPVVLLAEFYSSGGTRTYVRQLLDFYADLAVPVLLVSQHGSLDEELASLVTRHGFTYRSYASILKPDGGASGQSSVLRPWSLLGQLRERRAFKAFLANTEARSLVISVGTPGLFAGASGASSRSLYILHTYPHGRRQQILGRWFMAWLFRRTPHFVAVSTFQKGIMERMWRLRQRSRDIHVVPNTAGPVPARSSILNSQDPVVLTASWVEPYKEPQDWLDIAEQMSTRTDGSCNFIWMGEGSALTHMQNTSRSASRSASAEFRGHVDDMESAYASASVYLQTSSTENMSLSVIDALRWGLPAVVTDVGGLPEIVTDGECGFVVPVHDIERASDRIALLLGDSGMWNEMSRKARERYVSHFSPDIWASTMVRVHEQVMTGGAGDESDTPGGQTRHE